MGIIFAAVVVAIVLGVAALIYAAHLAEKKRTEELKQIASELGFDFLPQGDPAFFQRLSNFHLFSQGHSRRQSNLLRGRSQNLEVAIFDYRYVTGSGKHQHAWNHTVIGFRFDGPPLPSFSLRPESIAHKIGAWFGYQDINFDQRPEFSRKYLLRGDEAAVRALFVDRVLDFYEERPGLSTEGADNMLLFYRHAARVPPSAICSFMEEGFAVLGLFHSVK